MEKDTQNGTISYKNKTFGKGTFVGEYIHGALGDYPNGFGTASFKDAVLEGYFKKGEFLKGKMHTKDADFDGIYERDYLIEGRADLKNGDYYEGAFREGKIDLKKFRHTTDYGAVFEGETIHTQAQNGENVSLLKGTLREKDGSVQKGVFFATPPDKTATNYRAQTEAFSKNKYTYTLVVGKANLHFEDGALFRGFRINGAEGVSSLGLSPTGQALLAQAIKHSFDSTKPLSTQFNLGSDAILAGNQSYYEIVSKAQNNPNFFGVLTLEKEGKKCVMTGYFDILRQNHNAEAVRSYILKSGTVTAALPEGTLSASNADNLYLYSDKSALADRQKYLYGTLTDSKNNTVYTGTFAFDQTRAKEYKLDLQGNLNSGLKFIHGTIEVTQKSPESRALYTAIATKNGTKFTGEITYPNGDYKTGDFDLKISREKPVVVQFLRGKTRLTIDTTSQNGKSTVYTLEDFSLAPRKFNFLSDAHLREKATYVGDIVSTAELAAGTRITHKTGAFSGKFDSLDFELIEGDINSTLKGANGYSRVLSLVRVMLNNYPIFRGNQTTRNLEIPEIGSATHIIEAGEFEYDGDRAKLREGMLNLTAPSFECNLETKNGEKFSGTAVLKGAKASCVKSGEFVEGEPYTFLLNKGEIEYHESGRDYIALYDAEGIRAFDGAKFAGTLADNKSGAREIVITDDLSTIFEDSNMFATAHTPVAVPATLASAGKTGAVPSESSKTGGAVAKSDKTEKQALINANVNLGR